MLTALMLGVACDDHEKALTPDDEDDEKNTLDEKENPDTDTDTDSELDSGSIAALPECPYTNHDRTLQPLIEAAARAGEDKTDFGLFELGPGEPFASRDELGVGDANTEPLGDPSSLAFIWSITDSHIIDEESPARLINGDALFESAYRNQESWSTQLLEGAIRTVSAFDSCYPLDFTLVTGDMIENAQRNEMEWFIQIMEGGLVNPDSGAEDDPIQGEDNDPHDVFNAMGHPAHLPWYMVVGNHDLLALGNGALVDWMLADPTGDKANISDLTAWLNGAVTPTCLEAPFYATESYLPSRCYIPAKSYFVDNEVVPDANREFIGRQDWLAFFFGTKTIPDGHGFTQENLENSTASYVVEDVVPGMPITLIVLNTVAESGQDGVFDDARREWLTSQLDQAELDNKMVIVASHHTSSNIRDNQADQLVAVLNEYPHVAAHIGGHSHKNRIRPHLAPEGMPPEYGYWEIESSSTLVWPQQTRLMEFVDNRDGTGDIYCTMLDFQIAPDMELLEGARFYGLFDVQDGSDESGDGELTDRNAILRIAFPPALADKLALLDERKVMTFAFAPK